MRRLTVLMVLVGLTLALGTGAALAEPPQKNQKVLLVFTQGDKLPPLFDPAKRQELKKVIPTKVLKPNLSFAQRSQLLTTTKALGVTPPPTMWVEELVEAFKDYDIESIELWVKAAAESGGLLALAVDLKGEGGVKVVLKPR